jgi:hypothetical protein
MDGYICKPPVLPHCTSYEGACLHGVSCDKPLQQKREIRVDVLTEDSLTGEVIIHMEPMIVLKNMVHFTYSHYLYQPNCISSISSHTDNNNDTIVHININRHQIRDCCNSWFSINLTTKKIHIYKKADDRNFAVLDRDEVIDPRYMCIELRASA